jgi:hypothetical protein
MAGEFDASAAAGAFKDVFGGMQDVRIGCSIIQKLFEFGEGSRVGDDYVEMVEVQMPQGVSYTGLATSVTRQRDTKGKYLSESEWREAREKK